MADSFVSKLITELTAKTTAVDTDLVPVADSNGNFFKMTWQKMKQLLLGTKDISSVGDGTVTGAISELNTKIEITLTAGQYNKITNQNCNAVNNHVCLNFEIQLNNGSYDVKSYTCATITQYKPSVPIVCYAVNTAKPTLKRIYPCLVNTNGTIGISIGDTIDGTNNNILCHAEYTI